MKRNEIIAALENALTLKGTDAHNALTDLLASVRTSTDTPEGRITHMVHVQTRVLTPGCAYPRQMHVCMDILEGLGKSTLTLAEVKDAIGAEAAKLNTRQDPYRIYAFYQGRMEQEGWIKRETVRI